MRVTLAIDSATADEAHAFVAAWQRMIQARGDTVDSNRVLTTISGPWSWNIELLPTDLVSVQAVMADFAISVVVDKVT